MNNKDFNKQNNKLINLEWCSKQYNLDYSLNAGRYNFDFSKKKINQYDLMLQRKTKKCKRFCVAICLNFNKK